MQTRLLSALTAGAAALAFAATPAYAEIINFTAELSAAEEVPANDSAGTGTLEAAFDTETKVLTWTATFEGLTGPAVAAHFHGPADPGQNAGPVVTIEDLESPSEGEATLDDAQAADLQAGKWYVNFHTEQYPDGEIRGQVLPADTM